MIISAAKAQEAADVLEVELASLTSDIVSTAFRKKAKACHPDHHGTTNLAAWSRISWAKECLNYWVAQHPQETEQEVLEKGTCRACGGTGRVKVGRGFKQALTVQCVICKGVGSVIPEENDGD